MKKQFQVGDVVRLKSDGPQMTVDELAVDGDEEKVSCVWFEPGGDTFNTPLFMVFRSPCLEPVER